MPRLAYSTERRGTRSECLAALSKGQVIVAGAAVNTPVICRVRTRITKHGGESKDAPDIWQKYFSPEAQESRRRTEAPLNGNKGFNLMS